MRFTLLLAASCFLHVAQCLPVQKSTENNELVLLQSQVQLCGPALTDMLHSACANGSTNKREEIVTTSNNEHPTSRKERDKIVVECCWNPCSIRTLTMYCQHGLSKTGMELMLQAASNMRKKKQLSFNELKHDSKKAVASPLSNQVRGDNAKVKRRNDRFIGDTLRNWLGEKPPTAEDKPFITKCMYPSFAHFLLEKMERKHRGKIIKQPAAGLQVGTVTSLDFGGRPLMIKVKSDRNSNLG